MNAESRARGFTLVEMLLAVTISMLVAAGAVAVMLAQQRAFRSGSNDRAIQETARIALGDMAANLEMAGFGLDPVLAFDFGQMDGVRIALTPKGQVVTVAGLPPCAQPVLCRDATDSADTLVFRYRDPAFNHATVSPPTRSELRVAGPLNAPLFAGQVLQVACVEGEMESAFVTVDRVVPADAAAAVLTIPLRAGGTTYPLQNDWLERPCFLGAVRVLKVDTFRYFVQSFDAQGNDAGWNPPAGRSYLMLDQGLTGPDGPIVTPVAADVEDLQVTYLFPSAQAPAASIAPQAPNPLIDGEGGIDRAPAAGAPAYDTPPPPQGAARLTNHPSNIRGVRVAIVARSPEATAAGAPVLPGDDFIPAAGNRGAVPAREQGHRHILFETTVAPRNLGAATPYLPHVATDDFSVNVKNYNVGGG